MGKGRVDTDFACHFSHLEGRIQNVKIFIIFLVWVVFLRYQILKK